MILNQWTKCAANLKYFQDLFLFYKYLNMSMINQLPIMSKLEKMKHNFTPI